MRSCLSALIVLFLAGLVSCSPPKNKENNEKTNAVASGQSINQYPDIQLLSTDGQEISARQLEGSNIFVLFQPDCDHCQEEAVMIEQRIDDFKGYHLYFISSAPMEDIKRFAETFQLHDKPNVKFAWTSTDGVLRHYGAIRTPSVYIYSDGRLKQSFNGQTDIDTILNAL